MKTRMTKKEVLLRMVPHDGQNMIPGNHVDVIFIGEDTLADQARAEKNARRWGWIDEFGRLTKTGWRAI